MEVATVALLSDHPHLITEVAAWVFREWPQECALDAGCPTVEALAAKLTRESDRVWVAVGNGDGDNVGRLLGTVAWCRDDLPERPDLCSWMASLFVVPEARGRGIGKQLVAHFVAYLSPAQFPVYLYCRGPRLVAFYEALGWRVLSAESEPCWVRPPPWHQQNVTLMVLSSAH